MEEKLKEIIEPMKEILLLSPSGKKYRITITDTGSIEVEAVTGVQHE